MTKSVDHQDDDHHSFYDSLDHLLSSSNSDDDTTHSKNDTSNSLNDNSTSNSPTHAFSMCHYDAWVSQPSSVSERRTRLLRHFGLSRADPSAAERASLLRSKSDSAADRIDSPVPRTSSCCCLFRESSVLPVCSVPNDRGRSVNDNGGSGDARVRDGNGEIGVGLESVGDEGARTIRDLDNGKEFVVKEVREDGTWQKFREVGSGRNLTMEEFEMSVGNSPIVQELMRRQNVDSISNSKSKLKLNSNSVDVDGDDDDGLKVKKGNWFRSIKSFTAVGRSRSGVDESDTSSEKGGRRSSSATDDSHDGGGGSFLGPERVRVRQHGKSCKELTGLYKSQVIQAHEGSIWSIRFSLDGRYLASAGEDCVIHVWQVVESERKGELLLVENQKPEDGNLNVLLLVNGSPEPAILSTSMDNSSNQDKRRKGRLSVSRKSLSLDQLVVPETIFALGEKPVCSFEGHLQDVLDLSWSRSQVSHCFEDRCVL